MLELIITSANFLIFLVVLLVSYFASKGRYDEYISGLDKKEYSLKELFPLGFWINERDPGKVLPDGIKYYLRKLGAKRTQDIIELYGVKYSEYYTMLHNANRTSMGVFSGFVISLLGILMAVSGDAMTAYLFVALSYIALFGMPFVVDSQLTTKIKKRRQAIELEFPEFVNKMVILVNAGMTIPRAWEKITLDMKKKTPLSDELHYTMSDIGAGKPEAVAYEEFGRRCKVKEVIKFVSVVTLNLRKGGSEVVGVLRLQAAECWELRKSTAKRMGEEAATKLLFPMMIMFIGIILIVIVPALLSFSGAM